MKPTGETTLNESCQQQEKPYLSLPKPTSLLQHTQVSLLVYNPTTLR